MRAGDAAGCQQMPWPQVHTSSTPFIPTGRTLLIYREITRVSEMGQKRVK